MSQAGCVLTETGRKYITGELFTETYCFCLLHEYLVSLSFISVLVFSSITASTNFSFFSANGNHTVTVTERSLLMITMELNRNRSIISALLSRGSVDAVAAFSHSRFGDTRRCMWPTVYNSGDIMSAL